MGSSDSYISVSVMFLFAPSFSIPAKFRLKSMRFFGLLLPLSVSPLCGGLRVPGTSSPLSLDLDAVLDPRQDIAPVSDTIPFSPISGLFDRKALYSWANKRGLTNSPPKDKKMATSSKSRPKGPKAKPELRRRADCGERPAPLTPPTRPVPKSPPPVKKLPPPPPPPAPRFRSDKGDDGLYRPECKPRGKGSRSRQREVRKGSKSRDRSRSPVGRKGDERRPKRQEEGDLP